MLHVFAVFHVSLFSLRGWRECPKHGKTHSLLSTSSVLAPQWKFDISHLYWLSHDTGHHRVNKGEWMMSDYRFHQTAHRCHVQLFFHFLCNRMQKDICTHVCTIWKNHHCTIDWLSVSHKHTTKTVSFNDYRVCVDLMWCLCGKNSLS